MTTHSEPRWIPGDVVKPVLWCFGPQSLRELVHEINRQYRWAAFGPAPFQFHPSWARAYPPVLYTIADLWYNGCLGWPGDFDSLDVDEFEFAAHLRKKHPHWSWRRIERVAVEMASRLRNAYRDHWNAYMHRYPDVLGFLHLLTSRGAVVLLLDDAGREGRDVGGTAGIPLEQRRPRKPEPVVHLNQAKLADVVIREYWRPICVVPAS